MSNSCSSCELGSGQPPAMAENDVVYRLHVGDAEPLYLACCADIKEEIFQTAANLMQETLWESGVDSGQDVVFDATSLKEPIAWMESLAQLVCRRRIFDEHEHFRIASITKEGKFENTYALGVGTSNEKLKRASKLALAVAVAMGRPDSDAWLRLHNIHIAEDPLNEDFASMEHAATTEREAALDTRPRRARTTAPAARHTSRSRHAAVQGKPNARSACRADFESRSSQLKRGWYLIMKVFVDFDWCPDAFCV